MKVTLPVDPASAIAEVGSLAALLDKNGWKAAAFIAVTVKPFGDPSRGRLTATAFAAKLDAKGWGEKVILRHYHAWEAAANAGLVTHAVDLAYGAKVDVPVDGWGEWYAPTIGSQHSDSGAIEAQAGKDGTSAQKAVDIAKNTGAMQAAIKASPRVAEAAARALVDAGDIGTLSRATAAVAKNRQVDRNRRRVTEGAGRGATVQGPKPSPLDPGTKAFISVTGLADALRALVTTFPQQWARLSDDARGDTDFIATCEETCDQIQIALANIRNLIGGGVTDAELHQLLEAGNG